VKGVLIDSALYNNPERVFTNVFRALQARALSHALLSQTCNCVMWFLKEQHFALAINTTLLLQSKLRLMPGTSGFMPVTTQMLYKGSIR
jgi:hypothetical protein